MIANMCNSSDKQIWYLNRIERAVIAFLSYLSEVHDVLKHKWGEEVKISSRVPLLLFIFYQLLLSWIKNYFSFPLFIAFCGQFYGNKYHFKTVYVLLNRIRFAIMNITELFLNQSSDVFICKIFDMSFLVSKHNISFIFQIFN